MAEIFAKSRFVVNRYPVTYGKSFAVLGIGILTGNTDFSENFGKAIKDALNEIGIDANILPGFGIDCTTLGMSKGAIDEDPACSAISIFVGDKPT